MSCTRSPKLLDLVAVLTPPADQPVETGDVGTVVHLLAPDAVEVEFLDREGRTRCVTTLPVENVLVLNRQRTPVGTGKMENADIAGEGANEDEKKEAVESIHA